MDIRIYAIIEEEIIIWDKIYFSFDYTIMLI